MLLPAPLRRLRVVSPWHAGGAILGISSMLPRALGVGAASAVADPNGARVPVSAAAAVADGSRVLTQAAC